MEHLLKTYQRRLLNVSAGNKALLLRRLAKGLHLDWTQLDFLNNKAAFELLKEFLAGKTIALSPFADPRQVAVAPVSRQLQLIKRKSELLRQERGAPELFIGWPFVQGKFNNGNPVRTPLLFFPVTLELNQRQTWVLKSTGPALLNKIFLLAYAHHNGLKSDEDLIAFTTDGFPKDALAFRTQLYELLKESTLEINFNRELFEDTIRPFRSYIKSDFEKLSKPGELKLFPEAVLGIFPQAGSFLMADYDELLLQQSVGSLAELFKINAPETLTAKTVQEQNTFTAFELDAAQEAVLQEVKLGKSVVVQGPPGTGKSQLICNLITDFAARGKTVWVVCQKRAALEVVHKRLASKGLADFCALVHDAEADRRRVFDQLKFQIEETETYRKQNNSLPIVFAERQYLEISRRINTILQTLTDYKTALFQTIDCGWPVKELYLRSNLQHPALPLENNFRYFTAANLPDFLSRLSRLLAGEKKFNAHGFVLKDRKSFSGWSWPERQKLESYSIQVPDFFTRSFQKLPVKIQASNSRYAALQLLLEARPDFLALQQLLSDTTVLFNFRHQFSLPAKSITALEKEMNKLEKLITADKTGVLFLSEDKYALAEETIAAFEKAQTTFWLKTIWHLKSEYKNRQSNVLKTFGIEETENSMQQLKAQVAKHAIFQESVAGIRKLFQAPVNEDFKGPATLQRYLNEIKCSLQALKIGRKLIKENWLIPEAENVSRQLQALLFIADEYDVQRKKWQEILTGPQIELLANEPEYAVQLKAAVTEHFEDLVTHDDLWASFSEPEKTVTKALDLHAAEDVTAQVSMLENSIYLCWIWFLEAKYPVLRKAAGSALAALEEELQDLIAQKQTLSHEIVLTRLREKTYLNLEKNRLGNVVSYRRLLAQVNKKRGLYSLRKLQATFGEEISGLVPVWLASPETISAVFPLTQKADLVIFDEASQAFSEAGLPAIIRAGQVVITGDAAQLQPSDIYRSRWNSDDAEEEEYFVESLLELGSLHLPQHWLTQHYRSRFPELIQFSNRHFYRNKLQLIPDRFDLQRGEPAIEFIKVQGTWKEQTNLPEAEKVKALLFTLLQIGISDIGIITFNFAQQNLIQDLCETEAAETGKIIPESVLIKNIENIQGDEKDVIIFSVGYAPDGAGNMHARFGSLNQVHGANRLNVAVTRAVSKVYVISSIFAGQLSVENTLHEGPKLLKQYLHYAKQVSDGKFEWQLPGSENLQHPYLLKDQLKKAIQQAGPRIELTEKLPFADLVQEKNKAFCQLIWTDDSRYFSSLSVRHWHADIPFMLKKRNWPYTTFYSRRYWQHPESCIQTITESLC